MRYLYQPVGFRQVLVSLAFYGVLSCAMGAIAALAAALTRRFRGESRQHPETMLFTINFVSLVVLISQTDGSSASWEGWAWIPMSVVLLIGAAAARMIARDREGTVTVLLTSSVPIASVWLCFPSVATQLVDVDPSWFLILPGLGFALIWRSRHIAPASRYWAVLVVPLLVLLATAGQILYAGTVGYAGGRPDVESIVETGETRADVWLIVLDTVRADRLGSYGYARRVSPNLDRFAEISDRYENAYSTHTRTPESHRSLFTGRYAEHSQAETIAEELRGRGYSTIALSANRLALPADMHRGFDRIAPGVHNLPGAHQDAAVRTLLAPVPFVGQLNWFDNRWIVGDVYYPRATAMVDSAISWVESSEGPTFFFLNLLDAHDPYRPPTEFTGRFPGYDPALRYDSRLISDYRRTGTYTSRQAAHVSSQYDGEIAYLDSEIGRLFAYLQQTERFDRSLIVVTSDHGEGLGAHGFPTHGWRPYEEQARVPLLVKRPGQDTGRTIDGLWSLIDVKPMVIDSVRGATVTVESDENRLVLLNGREMLGIRKGPWKLMAESLTGKLRELYDLSQDPGEEHQLLTGSTVDEAVARLATEGFDAAGAAGLLKTNPDATLSRQQHELLRSLGYIQ